MAENTEKPPKRAIQNVSAITPALPNGAAPAPAPAPILEKSDLDALLEERARIDALLPARSLRDINIEKELVIQFLVVQQLQTRTLSDLDTPANQMAQVANSLASSLGTLAKLQSEVHNSERIKRIEGALSEFMRRHLTPEQMETFLDEYEKDLGMLG